MKRILALILIAVISFSGCKQSNIPVNVTQETVDIDGIEKDRDIVTIWEMDGYTRRLTNDGYTEAYDEETLNEYKEEYENAKYLYELAKANPLYKD